MVLVHVNNFWLVLGMAFKIYSGSKGLKLHVKNLGGLIPTFGEVTGEKLALQPFCLPPSWIGLKINHLIPMMVSRHSVSPPPHLFIEGLGVLKNHSRGSRCSCKNESFISLSFRMFIFLLIPFDTKNCYHFGLNLGMMLLMKVLFIKKVTLPQEFIFVFIWYFNGAIFSEKSCQKGSGGGGGGGGVRKNIKRGIAI